MIHDSHLADITTTAAVSGITANFLQPVLIGPAFLPTVRLPLTVRSMSMLIWLMLLRCNQTSRNHGVTYGRPVMVLAALITTPPVADLVKTLQKDYHAAVLAQRARAAKFTPPSNAVKLRHDRILSGHDISIVTPGQ